MDNLTELCSEALYDEDEFKCDSIARILLTESTTADLPLYQAKAHYYLGTYRYAPDSMRETYIKHLDKALNLLPDTNNVLRASIYNTKGIWALRYLQYDSSFVYFDKAIKLARLIPDKRLEASIESNLAVVYRFLDDTLGYAHTCRLHDFAIENKFNALILNTAYDCADYISSNSSDSVNLNRYLAELNASSALSGWVDVFRTQFYIRNGDYSKAKDAMSRVDSSMFMYVKPVTIMAELLNRTGKYEESNKWAQHGLIMYEKIHQDDKWPELHRLMSENYHSLGNKDASLKELRRYVKSHDSIEENLSREQVKAYRVKYEVDKKEQELALSKAETAKLKLIMGSAFVIIVIVVISVSGYFYRRRKHYFRIVNQSRNAIRREKELQLLMDKLLSEKSAGNHIEITDSPDDDNVARRQSGPSKEKSDYIFSKIMHEMTVARIWTDLTVTRESFADKVGCNRTYFSQVIKQQTGMTYNQFMNTHRIHEAVKILSDPSDNTPFDRLCKDLGFVSESTFYTTFKQIMGMTPASYRKIAKSEANKQSSD